MAAKKSAGFDNISVEIMKLSMPYIAEPRSCLINKSLTQGIVPDSLKVARICPVFKSGDKAEFTNYRPISILPSFSKFFEKFVYNRLIKYLLEQSILNKNQYGFHSKHDTSMAVIEMVDKISAAIDVNDYSVGLFIDLSKAFDTLDHKILFNKLYHYGIRRVALDWFKSYFKNCTHYVDYNGFQSSKLDIS